MFYLINVVTDLMLFFLGKDAIEVSAIQCANDNYLIVNNWVGALYMFFHTLTIMVYSFIMYHIFYRLPLKHNLISFKKRGATEIMTGERLKITGSMANQDAQLHDLIQIEHEER
jgi:hypothetical protein